MRTVVERSFVTHVGLVARRSRPLGTSRAPRAGRPSIPRSERPRSNRVPDDEADEADGMRGWSDARLISAARGEPADVAALDVLVERYWRMLFGRCRLLAADDDVASDLAQDAWCRVLRARTSLDPEGNFPAYLVTIATNLWRDRHRADRRAGGLADGRLSSLDDTLPTDAGDTLILADVLPDLHTLPIDEQTQLAIDVDRALACLTPRARAVLAARYLDDESAADIGRRYGRTEQTISGWVREAIRDVQRHLGERRLPNDQSSSRQS